jgi:DNA-binding transcriptional ArsR family regulator
MSEPDVHPVRKLGPTAWAVLEVLRRRSARDVHGALSVEVSIRVLAVELGLAKNTVHRAVRRLRQHGLIDARQPRTSAGTFDRGRYVVFTKRVTDDAREVVSSPALEIARRAPGPRRQVGRASSAQLSLEI